MSISDLSFCDHGYTKIKICPSCLREKDDQIDSLKSLLRSAHESIVWLSDHIQENSDGCLYCGDGEVVDGDTTDEHKQNCVYYKSQVWLTAYSSLTSSKSGMGAEKEKL